MNRTYSYDDVLLVPQYSEIRSRSEIDISSDLGKGVKLQLPILASPMDTISEGAMGNVMGQAGGTAIIHRYNTIEEQSTEVQKVTSPAVVGGAIGVSGDYIDRASALADAGATFLCIDVAHGHHIMMKEALWELRLMFGDDYHIMAGNVATLQGINDLADWGADSVRCNIGGGSICSTRIQTGHGLPGLQTIIECAKTDRDVKIIADGGIKNSGDMVKALAAGADAVMVGSLLAGTTETPGEIHMNMKGTRWKTYRGMASKEAQIDWKGKYSSFEGVVSRVPHQGPVSVILEDLERGIRSGFSYTGAHNLHMLHMRAQFVIQTVSGLSESGAHITTRNW
jgi:IMP dehydrogenase